MITGQQINTNNAPGNATVPGSSTAPGSTTVPGLSTTSGSTTEEPENATTRIAGSSDLPAAKRKRKPTKMEKSQQDVNATFEKRLQQQEDTKKSLLDLM